MSSQDHPLKVYYPLGGVHYILRWWKYNEQHQVLMAKSQQSLENLAIQVIKNDFDCKLKEYFQVEMVSPPKFYALKAKIQKYEQDVLNFMMQVSWQMKEVIKSGRKIPDLFEICQNYYDPDGGSFEEDENHICCKNCFEGLRLNNVSSQEFYEKYIEEWTKLFDYSPSPSSEGFYSQGREVKPDEILWEAQADLGHHCEGIEFAKVDFEYVNLNLPILFYFVKIKDVDLSNLEKFRKDNLEAIKRLRQEENNKYIQNNIQKTELRINKILGLFNS